MGTTNVDMSGKTCLITGANSGIGKATAYGLAEMGATVIMVCRDMMRGEAALREIREATRNDSLKLMVADLGSQQSIRNLTHEIQKKQITLNVLINNAAIIPARRTETDDGIEAQFGVNHLGPFLLTNLLLDVLKANAPARIVNVASTVHYDAKMHFDDLQYSDHKYAPMSAYAQSKLANVLFTNELARRLKDTRVTVNSLHPGVVRTNIARNAPLPLRALVKVAGLAMISPTKGAETSLYVATSPELEGVTGKYFDKCKRKDYSEEAHDEDAAERLWNISAEMVGL